MTKILAIIRRNLRRTCRVILAAARLRVGRSILGLNCMIVPSLARTALQFARQLQTAFGMEEEATFQVIKVDAINYPLDMQIHCWHEIE